MAHTQAQHLRLVRGGAAAQPRPSSEDLEKHAAGTPVSREVIDQVASTLANLTRGASLELALKVGEIVVHQIYGGDLDALRARGPKDGSFRKLSAHPRLPFSAVTLWRSVAIYELVQRFPGFAKAKHLGVAHLRATLGLPGRVQERLLRAAEVEGWTKDRLEQRAATYRQRGDQRRGRRPMPPALRCLRQLDRLAAKHTAAVEGLDLGEFDEGRFRDVEERLERLRAWCSAVERALAGRRGAGAGIDTVFDTAGQ